MFLMWLGAAGCGVAGIALIVAGQALVGGILVLVAVGMAALAFLLRPIMRSSREIAEQSGMEVSRLTGAPKMGSAMRNASERMQQAQEQMRGITDVVGGGLRNSGIDGKAVVKSATDTGEKRNMNPVYEVAMTVSPTGGPTGGPPYDTVVRTEVNSLAIAQCVPGTRVDVKIDPEDPDQVWIDWLAVAGMGGS